MNLISLPTNWGNRGYGRVEKLAQYTNAVFDQLRTQQDTLADEAVVALLKEGAFAIMINTWERIPPTLPDTFTPALRNYFNFYLHKEKEFSEGQHRQAQEFFERKGDLYLAMLGFYSLPYCYAFADGAQVLVRSNRILAQIGERLGETTGFVLDIFAPGAFTTQDAAYLSCAKVRLIHAYSRYFIHKHAKDWDPAFGQPVNQEDLLGTNLAFSYIVLRGLTKMGMGPSVKEQGAVLRYWKWIGELMGVETSLWPTQAKEAFALDKLIRTRQLRPSEAGQSLVQALLTFYKNNIPDPVLTAQLEHLLAFFLGKEAAQALDLASSPYITGDLVGLLIKLSGNKNFGNQKSHAALKKNLESQQQLQFGRVLRLQLPELKRP